MKRRHFLNAATLTALGLPLTSYIPVSYDKNDNQIRGTVSFNDNSVSIFVNAKISFTKIFHITDTHLSIDDKRGEKYLEFSKRMAAAYGMNTHFQTGEKYTTQEAFEMTLEVAKQQKADFLALTGDIFSFPSEAAVEWALQKLNKTNIPFVYVAGNHDWHYEGMKGSSQYLREIWIKKHLAPMYQGKNPLFNASKINGINIVCIDNSTYEILPEQLTFLKEQISGNEPMILLMHIPLYMPGRSRGYGCANPAWGEKTDKNFEIERREKWRKGGHTQVTFDFYNKVFGARNLLVVLAGHTHKAAVDVKKGIPQIVSAHNATGYYTEVIIDKM